MGMWWALPSPDRNGSLVAYGLTTVDRPDVNTFYGHIKFDSSGPHFHDNTAPKPPA